MGTERGFWAKCVALVIMVILYLVIVLGTTFVAIKMNSQGNCNVQTSSR